MDKGTVAAVVIVGVVLLIAAYYLTRPTGVNAGALTSGDEDTGGDRTARDVGAVFSGVGSALAGAGQAFSSVYGSVAGSAGQAGRAFAGGK